MKVDLFRAVWREIVAHEYVEAAHIFTEENARYNRESGFFQEKCYGPNNSMTDVFEDLLSYNATCLNTRQNLANVIDDGTEKMNVKIEDIFKKWQPIHDHGIEKIITGLAYSGSHSLAVRLR